MLGGSRDTGKSAADEEQGQENTDRLLFVSEVEQIHFFFFVNNLPLLFSGGSGRHGCL